MKNFLTNGFVKNDDAPEGGIWEGGNPGMGGIREPCNPGVGGRPREGLADVGGIALLPALDVEGELC